MAMPDPLIEVDRTISEIRRGAVVRVYDDRSSLLMLAVDALSVDCLRLLTQSGGAASPKLVMTGTRLNVLGIDKSDRPVSVLSHPQGMPLDLIEYLANPLSLSITPSSMASLEVRDADALEQSCVTLAKLARLLPAALIVEGSGAADLPAVQASSIQSYMTIAAYSLTQVSEARVPLENAENARVLAFRPRDGGIEHLAIVVGDLNPAEPVLVRLHSEYM